LRFALHQPTLLSRRSSPRWKIDQTENRSSRVLDLAPAAGRRGWPIASAMHRNRPGDWRLAEAIAERPNAVAAAARCDPERA
jgi:hypothetical protein